MRSGIVLVVLVVVAGYAAIRASTMIKARMDLADRVESKLDSVDETTIPAVKQELVHDAQKFGVALTPANIAIVCEETTIESIAQRLVGKTGIQFKNKRINIRVRYQFSLLGIPFEQDINRSKIRQVAVQAPERQREAERVLDSGL